MCERMCIEYAILSQSNMQKKCLCVCVCVAKIQNEIFCNSLGKRHESVISFFCYE